MSNNALFINNDLRDYIKELVKNNNPPTIAMKYSLYLNLVEFVISLKLVFLLLN